MILGIVVPRKDMSMNLSLWVLDSCKHPVRQGLRLVHLALIAHSTVEGSIRRLVPQGSSALRQVGLYRCVRIFVVARGPLVALQLGIVAAKRGASLMD